MPLIANMVNAIGAPRNTLNGLVGPRGFTVAPRGRAPLVVIYHLDTNRGDATIIVGADRCVFVDCGFDWVASRMIAIEREINGVGPHTVLISHFDKDHFYGIQAVTNASARALDVVTPADPVDLDEATHTGSCRRRPLNVPVLDSDLFTRFSVLTDRNAFTASRSCLKGNCTAPSAVTAHRLFSAAGAGTIQLGGGVTMKAVYNKQPRALSTLRENNDSSIAWVLSAAGINYYTAGDLEDGERHVKAPNGESLHIIKCGHHGSREATSSDFLARAAPVAAILQGCASDYGHPMPEVLQRLSDANVEVFATGLYTQPGGGVPMPTVCGDAQTVAGDIAVVIWNDGIFSAHWRNPDGGYYQAWDAGGAEITLSDREIAAVKCVKLDTLTPLAQQINKALEAAKMQHVLVAQGGPQRVKTKARKATTSLTTRPGGCEICARNGVRAIRPAVAECSTCGLEICARHEVDGDCSLCALY